MNQIDALSTATHLGSLPLEQRQLKSYTERDLIELACRAPAVPEWFQPDMSAFLENGLYTVATIEEIPRQRILQWPKAYARMVLEAK